MSDEGWDEMDSQSKEIERKFLEAIALKLDITGDTLVTFLARFSKENIGKTNSILAESLNPTDESLNSDTINLAESINSKWNKELGNLPQKIQYELTKICEIFKNEGWTWKQQKIRGRPKEGNSEYIQLRKWLWESRFPEWQQQQQLVSIVSSQEENSINNQNDIDVLVQEVRSRLLPFITDPSSPIGTMRMLSVSQPIPVDKIYIDLNILTQISRESHFSGWQQKSVPSNSHEFDRYGLSEVQERKDAREVVKKNPKLMVVGKPGSGKTTFLRSLAVECINPEKKDVFDNLVPIFVTLRDFTTFANKTQLWKLEDYLVWILVERWKKCDHPSAKKILSEGRALVLLDSLDEVPIDDTEKTIDAVQDFAYGSNQLVITCRTQSQRQLDGFMDVEVADFTSQQIDDFVDNWFKVVDSDSQASLAEDLKKQLRVKDNKYIAELTTTPVLLNLICVVFQAEKGNLPQKRFGLYDKAMRVLLERLNRKQPMIELLTFAKKEEFLSNLAFSLFQNNNYFPEQRILEEFVERYFVSDCFGARELLETFETETGLLIERSVGYWSFSHLTFHEYFVAQKLIKFNGKATDSEIKQLIELHILNRNWDEVFLLIAEQKSKLVEEEKVNE